MLVASAYLILCIMVAYLGRRTRLGFFRALLFSIMLTPFLIMLYLLILITIDAEQEGGKKEGKDAPSGATPDR
jgi:hypothetical protein